jgi:cytochrome b involved in lipid metabolism
MGVRTTQESSETVIRIEVPSEKNSRQQPPKRKAVAANSSGQSEVESSLWWIHGDGYDLNEFVSRHPGGFEAILLGKGRDCTALAESYHPFSSQHRYVRCQMQKDSAQ